VRRTAAPPPRAARCVLRRFRAGPPRSRFLLCGTGDDGHHALLCWAETDADFGDAPVLLATRMADRALDADGSRLVIPSDRCGARYVSAITQVWIGAWTRPRNPSVEPGLDAGLPAVEGS
jgi:hypothetical protein